MNSCNYIILVNYNISTKKINYSYEFNNYYIIIRVRIGVIIQY